VNQSRNWRDLITRVLPSNVPLSLRRRLLQQVVLLMWCLNAELRGSNREAVVLAPPAHALALKLGFQNPSVQRLLQQMAKEQFQLRQADWVDSVESREFGRVQQEITHALGGLERIRISPYRRHRPFSFDC
jgi:putative membrane protein